MTLQCKQALVYNIKMENYTSHSHFTTLQHISDHLYGAALRSPVLNALRPPLLTCSKIICMELLLDHLYIAAFRPSLWSCSQTICMELLSDHLYVAALRPSVWSCSQTICMELLSELALVSLTVKLYI